MVKNLKERLFIGNIIEIADEIEECPEDFPPKECGESMVKPMMEIMVGGQQGMLSSGTGNLSQVSGVMGGASQASGMMDTASITRGKSQNEDDGGYQYIDPIPEEPAPLFGLNDGTIGKITMGGFEFVIGNFNGILNNDNYVDISQNYDSTNGNYKFFISYLLTITTNRIHPRYGEINVIINHDKYEEEWNRLIGGLI